MPSYVVTGASRGLGYGFIKYLSEQDPSNIVIGLVRDKATTDQVVKKDNLQNVTILQADVVDRQALKAAKTHVENLTGGSLDYLINNAAFLSTVSEVKFLDDFENNPTALDEDLQASFQTNVTGVINVTNTFLPLIKKSPIKKVITLSTGMADLDLITKSGAWEEAVYSMSKAALNIAIAKYSARYKDDGILFLAVSPGVVDSGRKLNPASQLMQKFSQLAPEFKGPMTPRESAEQVLRMVESKSVEKGDSGAFISHHGDKNWF